MRRTTLTRTLAAAVAATAFTAAGIAGAQTPGPVVTPDHSNPCELAVALDPSLNLCPARPAATTS